LPALPLRLQAASENDSDLKGLRGQLESALEAGPGNAHVFAKAADRLPNTVCFALPGLAADTALIAFDLDGVAVSSGSACSSGKVAASHVLEAMGAGRDRGGIGHPGQPGLEQHGWRRGQVYRQLAAHCRETYRSRCSGLNESSRGEGEAQMADLETIEAVKEIDVDKYKYGFETIIESDMAPKGLSEEVIRFISAKKEEPEWMLEQRLEAYQRWLKMDEPTWAKVSYPKIDFNDIYYYAAPKGQTGPKSLDEVDPELLATYAKLGIPLKEQEILAGVRKQGEPSQLDEDGGPSYASGNVAVDAVFDSVSVVTTFKKELAKAGVIFCSISEAIREHPELVKKYLFSVVPQADNFYAALNSAVFTDGSFVYIPEGVRCPMELSTYFRINAENTGQFERTLIIAEKGSYVSYLEGCTAPMRDENQLHAAVVELVALEDAEIKYSTVQNWYPGDKDGKGGIYNFVTKRADCRGNNSKVSWTQVETGSAVTWKYPSCILRGDNSRGEFYSIAISNGYQQVDSGTKMIHLGKNTTSRIISKGIAAGHSDNTYRGIVSTHPKAKNARNFTQCDSLLIGDKCGAHTVPYIEAKTRTATFEHEATTSKISDDMLFYCQSRGLNEEEAVALVVNGFVRDVLQQLPMEFMAETQKLIGISLEGSVG
jgi:Fe-S cluster assembly protein SufB